MYASIVTVANVMYAWAFTVAEFLFAIVLTLTVITLLFKRVLTMGRPSGRAVGIFAACCLGLIGIALVLWRFFWTATETRVAAAPVIAPTAPWLRGYVLDWLWLVVIGCAILFAIGFVFKKIEYKKTGDGLMGGAVAVVLLACLVGGYASYRGEPFWEESGTGGVASAPSVFRCADSSEMATVRCPLSDAQWVSVPPTHPMDPRSFDLCLSISGPLVDWQRIGDTLRLRAQPGAAGQVAAYRWLPHPAHCPSLI
ncbi:hypothetical protein KGO04_04505 [Patescibacteria group bacterium]|nr:hypothetical protein [Patescibacteria group bacterium]MDE1943937.1 hypothetical protein [Patescibacteria group bacterium]MDE1945484.1 hypothetical protein [Patescibacteria group bacterium]